MTNPSTADLFFMNCLTKYNSVFKLHFHRSAVVLMVVKGDIFSLQLILKVC